MEQIVAENFDFEGETLEENEEPLEEEIELSEELEEFISSAIEQGLSEEEIVEAIAEEFDLEEESALFPSREKYGKYTKRAFGALAGAGKELGKEIKKSAPAVAAKVKSKLHRESFEVDISSYCQIEGLV